MSNTQSAQEPSMEEILASIRKIISEDDSGAAVSDTKAGASAPAKAPAANGFSAFAASGNAAVAEADPAERDAVRTGSAPSGAPSGFKRAAVAFSQDAAKDAEARSKSHAAGEPGSAYAPGGDFEGVPAQDPEEDEVLDLTEMVGSDGRVVKITPQGLSNGHASEPQAEAGVAETAPHAGDHATAQTGYQAPAAPDAPADTTYVTGQNAAGDEAMGPETMGPETMGPETMGHEGAAAATEAAAGATPLAVVETADYDAGHRPAAFGAAFGQAAKAEAAQPESAHPVLPGEAETAEAAADDHVPYAQADLDGPPAYLTGHGVDAGPESGEAAMPGASPATEPAAPEAALQEPEDDAFAELAGTDNEDETTMTDSYNSHATESAAATDTAFAPSVDETAAAASATSHLNGAANGADAGPGAGLEAIVRKTADPMVRQWIEDNMSDIVERLVREEVARRLSGNG